MTIPAYLETHTAIVGTTGAGKTVTGKGYVEQLLDDGRQVIVLDPTGAWWGMQSNAAGDGPGFRIPIFGGLHANVPIGGGDGARVAQLLVDQRVSAIIDLSEFEDEETSRAFALDFVTTLRTKPIGNLHLVVDEADEFCPEVVPDSDSFKLKRQLAWIAKRGRIRGFVLTIITQRPSDTAKMVLALAQTLVVHRLIAPQDQGPVDRYLKSYATVPTRKEVLGSLAGLQRGERWVYNPMEGLLERGTSPALRTFDSSAAPIAGRESEEPQALADVDFAALAEALAVDQPAEDPIAEAEADEPGAWDTLVARVAALEEKIRDSRLADEPPATSRLDDLGSVQDGRDKCPRTGPDEPRETGSPQTPAVKRVTAGETAPTIGPERKPLAVLAGFSPAGLSDAAWATVAGFKRTGGTWSTYRGRLKKAGLIEQGTDKLWRTTDAGDAAIGKEALVHPSPGPGLVAFWASRVPGAGRMLRRLGELYPQALTRDALAADLGMSASGGTFGTYLGRLRGNGLLEERGKRVRVAPPLMGDVA